VAAGYGTLKLKVAPADPPASLVARVGALVKTFLAEAPPAAAA
jgi:hypothetical protein